MSQSKPRILAIDDAPQNLMLLGAALANEFAMQIATSGAVGLALAAQNPPHLILLDVMMPEMDGFEVCRRLKADPKLKDIPVVFVTASHDEDSEMTGLALGAADYLNKPVNVQIARQRIRNLLARDQALRRLTQIANRVPGVLYEYRLDSDGSASFPYASEAICAFFGHRLSPAGIREDASPVFALIHPDDLAGVRHTIAQSAAKLTLWHHEFRIEGEDATVRWLLCNAMPEQEADGAVLWHGFISDITERRRAEENMRLAASVFSNSREGIMITGTDGTIVDVNEAFSHITGYGHDEVVGRNPRILSSGRQKEAHYAAMWRSLTERGHWCGEVWNRRKNGEVYAELQTISTVRDANSQPQYYVSLFSDITAAKHHEQQLENIAYFDALTHLPNRVLLADRLSQSMTQARRRGLKLAVVFLDLDGFKAVNDRHGHDAGDHLLMALAKRMAQSLREGDTLARIGGDEFVAVLADLKETTESMAMLDRLLAAASEPVPFEGVTLQVSASLGVTFYPQDDDIDADQLQRQADQAMYQAKVLGKNRYQLFDAEHDRSVRVHQESRARIRHALAHDELVLHYQPKVNMRTGQVLGAEALLRWQHPELGLLAPGFFLPDIENHPLAIDVGEWVMRRALSQMQAWHAVGLDLPVSVNVGARQLQQHDFVARLQSILADYPARPPGCLELEVLETSALEDIAGVSQVIDACRALGVAFSLDDFGTGYSSLTYLKRLPVALLKIDRSFVCGMLNDPDDLAILQGVIGLARAFKREVIAEGVETVAHGTALLQLGCELAQGFGVARPMPAEQLPGWVQRWRHDAAWAAFPPPGAPT